MMGVRYHEANPDVLGAPGMSAEGAAWLKTWPGVPSIHFTDGYNQGFQAAVQQTLMHRGAIPVSTGWEGAAQ